MRRLSATDVPVPVALVTFGLAFVVGFLSLSSLPSYLARKRLQVRAEIMLVGMRELAQRVRSDLMSLPPLEDLKCQSRVSPVLSRHEFQNPYVRWFGVSREGQVICASMADLTLISAGLTRRVDDSWSLRVVQGADKADSLLLIQNRGDLQYQALLDPMLFEFDSALNCVGCVSHEAVIPGNPQLVLRSGPTSSPSVIHWTTEQVTSFSKLTLTVAATQEYVERFKPQGRLLAAGIAAPTALCFSFLVYGLLVRRMSQVNLIRQGLRRHEFFPHYQPIVDARSGSLLGAEALVRWRRHGKLIPPSQFIEYAEEGGLIAPITDQLIVSILADLRRLGWIGTDRYISINVTPNQIMKSEFCETLVNRLAESGIPGGNVAVEITERQGLSDLQEGRRRLSRLAAAGIDIKIDDAGTGFGGFSYVQELPISTLKIDRMFVDTLRAQGDAKRPVLDAIIHFAQTSGLGLIAEGVETQAQVSYLANAGVQAIQGFVYARPMPVDQFISWIEARGAQVPSGLAKSSAG